MQDSSFNPFRFGRAASGRRGFVTAAAGAALGAVALGRPAAAADEAAAAAAAVNDADILNFALNLEYLEAQFYLRAVNGSGLSANETGAGAGKVTGGSKVPFKTKAIRAYAEEIAADERAHVDFLRKALGKAAVSQPEIDLQNSFTTAAKAAGLIKGSQTFNPFADEDSFLLGAFIFEDVGVTAYKGAAPLLDSKDYLAAAAGILAVEAYHASNVRTTLFARGLFKQAQAISDARDKLDADGDKDQGIGSASKANIVPTDSNGLAFDRTTDQVLSIVYLGGKASNYGFFPKLLNGKIS